MGLLGMFATLPTKQSVPALERDEEFESRYNALAKKVGLAATMPNRTHRVNLLAWLHEQSMTVYDTAVVERYMDLRNDAWAWYGLRAADFDAIIKKGVKRATRNRDHQKGGINSNQYAQPVPYPVMLTVEKLIEKFGPQHITFLVAAPSARIIRDPDPFLGVFLTADTDTTPVVIERWDEPSFRG